MPARLRALLATARIANVPSVAVNVLTGMLLQRIFHGLPRVGWNENTLFPMLAACCLYVAGNFLNDWYDASWDKQYRSERAIPSGLFTRDFYLSIAMMLVIAGGVLAWWVNNRVLITYVVILLLVIGYTLLHKRQAFSIWIMGACRAGLYVLGLAALPPGIPRFYKLIFFLNWHEIAAVMIILFPLLGMIAYIAGISLLARYESRPADLDSSKWFAALLLLFPSITHLFPWVIGHYFAFELARTWVGILGILPFLGWTLFVICRRAAVGQKVSGLLAGIALVDSIYFLSVGLAVEATPHYVSLFSLSFLPLLAFFLALLLQKLAPAT